MTFTDLKKVIVYVGGGGDQPGQIVRPYQLKVCCEVCQVKSRSISSPAHFYSSNKKANLHN